MEVTSSGLAVGGLMDDTAVLVDESDEVDRDDDLA